MSRIPTILVHPDRKDALLRCLSGLSGIWCGGVKIVECDWVALKDVRGEDVLGYQFNEDNLKMSPIKWAWRNREVCQ